MQFRIDRHFRISDATTPTPGPPRRNPIANLVAKREAICRACPRFLAEIGRCMGANCGCPSGTERRQPWKNLRRCGEKRW